MHNDVAIRVEGLGKKYILGHKGKSDRPDTFRDAIVSAGTGLLRTVNDVVRGRPIYSGDTFEEFWALRDVGFEVKQGEAVGIIGRNGAGKSTLLKVLSRITEPTEGRVTIRGRIASLLEVGTGFHPELSGRENIFLNGAILGMSRAEVLRKFDEIVDFAEVERFLDTPVKRYSSGMYVRLAFAVAAHLEPEVLVVDEVLAVGDAEFQAKCLGKMSDVASKGRTVLFVSHNIAAVSALCSSGIFLNSGQVNFAGPIDQAISAYLGRGAEQAWVTDKASKSDLHLTRARVADVAVGQDTTITLEVEIYSKFDQSAAIELALKDRDLTPVAWTTTSYAENNNLIPFSSGVNKLQLKVNLPQLALGRYSAGIVLSRPVSIFLDRQDDILNFSVNEHVGTKHVQVFNQSWGGGCFSGSITVGNSLR